MQQANCLPWKLGRLDQVLCRWNCLIWQGLAIPCFSLPLGRLSGSPFAVFCPPSRVGNFRAHCTVQLFGLLWHLTNLNPPNHVFANQPTYFLPASFTPPSKDPNSTMNLEASSTSCAICVCNKAHEKPHLRHMRTRHAERMLE